MAKFITLFGTQSDADLALEKLNQLPFYDQVRNEVLDSSFLGDTPGVVVPVVQNPGSYTGNMPGVAALPIENMDLDDDAHRFFLNGLRGGGVLVITETADDDQAAAIWRLFRAAGGRNAHE
jgi:hypothetical protein